METGALPGPVGARATYVTRSDCAAVAAAILAEGGHEGQFLEITGPEAVDVDGIARALTEATGRPVRFEPQTASEAAAAFEARGVQREMAEAAAQFWRCAAEGWLDTTTHAVRRIAGRPPTTLAEFFETQRNALL
ncbi:NAD(P)H dehydrogenase (quinone) [Saccharopolyspora antimicrobica]|uniref:NAD(P)H dehydrogenase (Quinone) n=1 Tax=Saccharopolyspora antimicrobica TaxID=455193 RepID=A0A1I4TQW9_9PSEU|nr:hypothetical protein [Saccharopolyspora antimicrobica]SFM78937.1 NAD(P)H dehydrogenase (quinone) [Saccharopolyspora antimicrobica]